MPIHLVRLNQAIAILVAPRIIRSGMTFEEWWKVVGNRAGTQVAVPNIPISPILRQTSFKEAAKRSNWYE